MHVEEAYDKAWEAVLMDLITEEQIEDYVAFLLKRHGQDEEPKSDVPGINLPRRVR